MTQAFDRPERLIAQASTTVARTWKATDVQTQVATRLVASPQDDAGEQQDIGRAVGNGVREMFVTCEPAEALGQQFDHLRPEFVTVHDLGTNQSRKLLTGIAAACSSPVQKLSVRRNGAGTELAVIEFVDVLASNGKPVRFYSTEVEADTVNRQAIARVLLGRSLLGIVMVAELPAHALASALAPWREAALRSGWRCARLLFMPLGPGAALPAEIGKFRNATSVNASATSRVTRPAEVWSQLGAAWNDLQRQRSNAPDSSAMPLLGTAATERAAATARAVHAAATPSPAEPGAAPAAATPARAVPGSAPAARDSRPAPLAATPSSHAPLPMPVIGALAPSHDAPLERYLHDLSHVVGVVSACAFDTTTGRAIGHAGARPGPDDLARHGTALLTALAGASRDMGLGAAVPDCSITFGQHHLLLRAMPAHPGLALHLVLDKAHASLGLVLAQMRRLDEALIDGYRAVT